MNWRNKEVRLLLSIWKEPVIAEKIAAKSKEVCVEEESAKIWY